MKVLFIGDIVGSPGRKAAKKCICELKKELSFDYCIANGENTAGGKGITYVVAQELYNMGVDAITMGNHTWSKKEITNFIDSDPNIVRPANYPDSVPGRGSTIIDGKLGIINLLGRVYMEQADCPFRAMDRELQYIKSKVKAVVVDIHAEASSEKCALAWYGDGRVSGVVGTHTHVQTADERILPCGTAFITDVGMTGPYEGIIGVDKDIILEKFISCMPVRFELAKGIVQFNGVFLDIDEKTGKAININRISKVFQL
ncbi:MAG: TIGR00282 family metallophosphoesterase [Clostridiaceae bacterium]|nr:TIGR00282 family metallophosphoesterase [Clostridiaceae bacterium]